MTSTRSRPPRGACDCHIHICDSSANDPLRPPPAYALPHAPFETHRANRDAAGLDRSIAVQIVGYGEDNSVMVQALRQSRGTMRGIASARAGTPDAELERLHEAGVRGLRFYLELPRPMAGVRVKGVGLEDLTALAPRMRALGWVAEISATVDRIAELGPRLQGLGVPIVLEHMAGCAPEKGLEHPAVQDILKLLRTGTFWLKLTVSGMSGCAPEYSDLKALHQAFVVTAPERMLWGSDWPHIGQTVKGESIPDYGRLLDLFDEWSEHDESLRRRILSENPAQLFGFQE